MNYDPPKKMIGPILPTQQEQRLARRLTTPFQRYRRAHKEIRAHIGVGDLFPVDVVLPATAVKLLRLIILAMAQGKGVSLLVEGSELSTQDAATVLRMSRSKVVRLLEEGRIPYYWVGKHRRIRLEDVVRYKREFQLE